MRKILEQCPTCDHSDLVVTELSCPHCQTTVRSHYRPTVFSRLSAENLRFVEIFVKNRGNVKEMERELGVSYWSIRTRLDEIITALRFDEPLPAASVERQAVLEQLEAGAITVAEAAARLSRPVTEDG